MRDIEKHTCGECRFFGCFRCTSDRASDYSKERSSETSEACVCFKPRVRKPDKRDAEIDRLNAENDKLRKIVRSACIEFCHDCDGCVCNGGEYKCISKAGDCFVQEWRKAIGMNGGEE